MISKNLVLEPCDIFFTHSDSILGKGIRFCTRSIGEEKTKVNHVGAIVTEETIDKAQAIEALTKVRRHTLMSQYGGGSDKVAIYRPLNITPEQALTITAKLNEYEGRTYGYAKIVTHWLDWCLNGAYVFRRLTGSDRYPICSWVVAQAFSHAGLDFGVKPGAATPDDIWDYCVKHKDKYELVLPLMKI